MGIWTYNERDCQTSGHKITQDELTCRWNQAIIFFLSIYSTISLKQNAIPTLKKKKQKKKKKNIGSVICFY